MNPLPNIDFPYTAPIPHQFAMKVYVDTWIYVTEKFGKLGYIEVYRGILRYETGIYPTIPNFIFKNSFVFHKKAPFRQKKSGAGVLYHGRKVFSIPLFGIFDRKRF